MTDESTEPYEEEITDNKDDWENRILCADESCIGVIGPDGRCKECGKSYEESPTGESNASQNSSELDDDIDMDEESRPDTADNDWENRFLCSDESCIGVIGPDGRCKECGKPYKG
ncbi:MAG: hypothetical protein PVI71_02685 [Desulfobacterales bacterium]|jgi:hypothetical protein